MRTITKIILALATVALLAWPVCLAFGQELAAVTTGSETALLKQAYDAVTHGDYAPAAVILLIALVWFIRMDHTRIPVVGNFIDKTFGKLVRWSRSDRGGVIAVFVTSILGGVLHTITVGGVHALSGSTVKLALGLGIAAIGGWTGVKRLFFPADAVPALAEDGPTKPSSPPPVPPAA
jgi:hypothetical protein